MFASQPPADLTALEAALAQLRPASGQFNRDQVLFLAGRASVRQRVPAFVWPGVSAGLAVACVVLALRGAAEPTVESIHVAATAPNIEGTDHQSPDRQSPDREGGGLRNDQNPPPLADQGEGTPGAVKTAAGNITRPPVRASWALAAARRYSGQSYLHARDLAISQGLDAWSNSLARAPYRTATAENDADPDLLSPTNPAATGYRELLDAVLQESSPSL